MSNFRLTVLAKQDLKAIGRYTQKIWGKEQRNIYLAKIDASLQLIASEPGKGRTCDHIRLGYRKYRVGRHIIFYLQKSDYVEIIRILHSQMDLEAHFDDEPME
jgi:toxin ParE1/3/4